ncbi:MAG TPA: glycosyltransferase [Mycobacteriales bacterium]|nr:glycosyltransferase [Mycobacteriales bacterium]
MTTRYGFVSTYPPTQCGLATFTSALFGALVTADGGDGRVVRVVETPQPWPTAEVVGELLVGDAQGPWVAAELLNASDVVIVQHEYGVYGGRDGAAILTLLDALRVPCVVVLHTVLTEPSPHQRLVLEAVVGRADAVVTMTAAAWDRLAVGYAVDMRKVSVIPHGAHEPTAGHGPVDRTGRPTVLTWGLIGPGKGIEWGIEAMSSLAELDPAPRYVVSGHTHPKVLLREGEAYRDRLRAQVRRLGLGAMVTFDGRYRDAASLAELVRSADVVLLPYDSTDQVTSGVLIEAVAALRPVVATRFPHAVELLGGGAGLLVEHKNPTAIAAALRQVLTRGDLAAGMTRAAAATAPTLHWPAVAERYRELAMRLIAASLVA